MMQQHGISSGGISTGKLGNHPSEEPNPSSPVSNLAELSLPKAPAENLLIDDTRGKKTTYIIFHASHHALLVSI